MRQQPKNFGFTGLDIAKVVGSQLGISGLKNLQPIWKQAASIIEKANPCECDDRCYCSSCTPYGCTRCFSEIVRYILNIRQKAYRVRCSLDTCENCGSNRNNRNVRRYETRDGNDVLIRCSDC